MLLPISVEVQTFDSQALLDAVKQKVAATVRSAPRYTCVESIERYWYANHNLVRPGCDTDRPHGRTARNLVRSDRLRLDVAVGSGQEMFAWHGQKSFQTEEVDQIVTAGPISSGNYFAFLSSIFLEGAAKIDFRGLRDEAGRPLAVFGYAVPIGESGFETRTESGKAVMGYHGEFTIDPEKKVLEQLEIFTDDMPESVQVCGFNSRTQYETKLLNNPPFELPARVEMDVLYRSHERAVTVTQYSECHEFAAESALRFDDGAAAANKLVLPKSPRTFPSGLAVPIRIRSQIDLAAAWAGDAVEGELAEDIVDSEGRVLAPAGATVQGLFLRVEKIMRPVPSYSVAVQFREMRASGEDYALSLKSILEPVSHDSGTARLPRRLQLDNSPISDDPQAFRFLLRDKNVKLKGVLTYWETK